MLLNTPTRAITGIAVYRATMDRRSGKLSHASRHAGSALVESTICHGGLHVVRMTPGSWAHPRSGCGSQFLDLSDPDATLDQVGQRAAPAFVRASALGPVSPDATTIGTTGAIRSSPQFC